MGLGDRMGNPFRDSKHMGLAFNDAAYMRLYMALRIDPISGDIASSTEPRMAEMVAGSAGVVLATDSVSSSILCGNSPEDLSPLARLLNVAFMLGRLSAETES